MKGYDVHGDLIMNFENHGFLVRSSVPGAGPKGHVVKMYKILQIFFSTPICSKKNYMYGYDVHEALYLNVVGDELKACCCSLNLSPKL